MLKHEIKNILIKFMVDEEILDPSALSSVLITQTDSQLRELEIQRRIQLEKLRLEQEERIRVEQLELEERMLKLTRFLLLTRQILENHLTHLLVIYQVLVSSLVIPIRMLPNPKLLMKTKVTIPYLSPFAIIANNQVILFLIFLF